MKQRVFILLATSVSIALLAGCAATGAIESARRSFEQARAAGAETKAPYEYYAAEAYLERAKDEVTEGDTAQAKVFAGESEAYAAQALSKAKGGAK